MSSLNIILDPCASPGILSAKLWIREGSRADPINKKGMHNLLGLLLSRGCGPYNNEDLADIIEGSGAELLCETYEDGLMISLKCTETKSSTLLPILDYMITAPHLEKSQLNLERNLIIQSINRQKENPFNLTFRKWKQVLYNNHPYSHETIGEEKELKSIKIEEIKLLSKKFLHREKVIIIAGTLPKKTESYLQDLKSKSSSNLIIDKGLKLSPLQKFNSDKSYSKSIVLSPIETNQVVIIIGTLTIPHCHPDDLILRLLACHLGAGMSSVLFKTLREKNGLAYDVGAYHPIREYESPFLIHASSSNKKSLLSLKLLKKCWEDIQNIEISEEELDLAKSKFKGNLAYNSQTISQRAERKAHLIGIKVNSNIDYNNLGRLEHITTEEIRICALKYFKKPLLSISGQKEYLDKLSQIWIAK